MVSLLVMSITRRRSPWVQVQATAIPSLADLISPNLRSEISQEPSALFGDENKGILFIDKGGLVLNVQSNSGDKQQFLRRIDAGDVPCVHRPDNGSIPTWILKSTRQVQHHA